ncbi:7091_t:CDS:2, partial [Racocetra fulgida]
CQQYITELVNGNSTSNFLRSLAPPKSFVQKYNGNIRVDLAVYITDPTYNDTTDVFGLFINAFDTVYINKDINGDYPSDLAQSTFV